MSHQFWNCVSRLSSCSSGGCAAATCLLFLHLVQPSIGSSFHFSASHQPLTAATHRAGAPTRQGISPPTRPHPPALPHSIIDPPYLISTTSKQSNAMLTPEQFCHLPCAAMSPADLYKALQASEPYGYTPSPCPYLCLEPKLRCCLSLFRFPYPYRSPLRIVCATGGMAFWVVSASVGSVLTPKGSNDRPNGIRRGSTSLALASGLSSIGGRQGCACSRPSRVALRGDVSASTTHHTVCVIVQRVCERGGPPSPPPRTSWDPLAALCCIMGKPRAMPSCCWFKSAAGEERLLGLDSVRSTGPWA